MLGMTVRAGPMTVRMPVQIVAMRMEMSVGYGGNVRMRIGRSACAAHAHTCQSEDAKQDEHDADGKFHRHARAAAE